MNPEIRTIEHMQVLFVRKHGEYVNAAPKPAWAEIMEFAEKHNLITTETKKIGVCHDDRWSKPESNLRYDACITVNQNVAIDKNIGKQTIAGGKFAVFIHRGPFENLDETYHKIFGTWLPQSGTKARKAPILEFYLNCEQKFCNPENLKTEICIPIDE